MKDIKIEKLIDVQIRKNNNFYYGYTFATQDKPELFHRLINTYDLDNEYFEDGVKLDKIAKMLAESLIIRR